MFASRTLAAISIAFAAFAASAQTPAPASAPAPATAPATPKCDKPDPHPGSLASPEKLRGWNKEVTAWQTCMKKSIAEMQAKADQAIKIANAAVAESNAAIADFNTTIKEFNAQAEAAR